MERGAFMNKQEWIEQLAKSWVDFCTNLLAEVETEKEQINKKLRTIEEERQEEIEQQKEYDEALTLVLEALRTETKTTRNELSELQQKFVVERNKRKELGKAFLDFRDKQKEEYRLMNEAIKNLKQDLQSVSRGLDVLKQENDRLKQENANLRQLEANWSKHTQDDTRHVKRVTGPTPQSQAKASEVNRQRAEETNIKVFRAIFGYLQNAQDKSKVDMSWLLKTTGLSESTIRQTVKELQEGRLNNHIQKRQDGSFWLYGLYVPTAFISWKDKATFFNVSR